MIKYLLLTFILPLFLSMTGGAMALDFDEEDFELKLLGKHLFFDTISFGDSQSCSSCHVPDVGWTNGDSATNAGQVAVTGARAPAVGNLKPPSNAYARFVPVFKTTGNSFNSHIGGNLWNGRATGTPGFDPTGRNVSKTDLAYQKYNKYLGPTADQAHASPFINPLEQALLTEGEVCERVRSTTYAPLYAIAYKGAKFNCSNLAVFTTFARFAVALAAYQHSSEVNPFDSKRDRALANDRDGKFPLRGFTRQENRGRDLFYGVKSDLNPTGKNANCAFCHRSGPAAAGGTAGTDKFERYTNSGYFNIGTPANFEIPQVNGEVGDVRTDPGLAFTTRDDSHKGRHKVPTLRNVDKRRGKRFIKAYTHNGWFKSLESLVHFYNTRDIKTECKEGTTDEQANKRGCWPAPEFVNNKVVDIPIPGANAPLGNLGLDKFEEAALVAYLKTLSDKTSAKAPEPFNLKKFRQLVD